MKNWMSGHQPQPDWKLWYRQPAAVWEEALPLGNGRLGAMVFGRPDTELIQMNEDTLWSGFPRDTVNYDSLRYLKAARELIFEGKYKEAETTINRRMLGRDVEAYQPMGDVLIRHDGLGEVTAYQRELLLNDGLNTVNYSSAGVNYSRQTYISTPDHAMVTTWTADQPASISTTIWLDSPHPYQTSVSEQGVITLQGRGPTHIETNYFRDHPQSVLYEEGLGVGFAMALSVQTSGGTMERQDGRIMITGADAVTMILVAVTDYEGYDRQPGSQIRSLPDECRLRLDTLRRQEESKIRERHYADHRELFNRVEFSLNSSEITTQPTDERLATYQNGAEDPSLEALYFHYGRYLLMGSSRPGTQAANLQGIWNNLVEPPWYSDFTTNINTQMNYWPAEVCNLSELHEPLIQLVEDLSHTGRRAANLLYQAKGWTAHHNVDIWRAAGPSGGDASWAFWPMGGIWLATHLWEHYQFTHDREFLIERAYPVLKGAAAFALDWLVEGPEGYLVTAPSTSPENKFLTAEGEVCSVSMASTMDISLITELFHQTIEAAIIAGTDHEFADELKSALERLSPLQVGRHGQLQEWFTDFDESEPGHRHVSHLFSLYPGSRINRRDTPELLEAARVSLERRIRHGGGHTGWSCAWLINLYARLLDAETAYRFVRTLLAKSTYPNLFDAHPPFQIDGNFGGTAGMAEMLLQSHLDELHLLPALPDAWNSGRVRGLRARGGCSVDMQWQEGRLVQAAVRVDRAGMIQIRTSDRMTAEGISSSQVDEVLGGYVLNLQLEAGQTAVLHAKA
ncbi:glycoside hydrolase family 95 protein [Paenibacillus sp. JX-17]|uniref:Glycoside hydrolase family 95 protein n=1 Tax=Paenibacillus lacisoli TaxID=3064525 RepID=A0ABT9CJN7_9BACL|nr:glycoside hydrolase family 95 protein [Paenibacillus sp. JX-17]MDO7907886.1 glycoside hydrolase family 95 protein [Paenibacillus sp. JX-17]